MATYKSIRYIVPTEAVEHTDSINALSDVDTNTTAPTDGQILKWNNTTSKWYPGDVEEASNISTTLGILVAGAMDTSSYYEIGSHVYVSNTGTFSQVSFSGDIQYGGGATYGGDKGFICQYNSYHLLSNTGVVGSNVSASVLALNGQTGLTYGLDKAIFGWGFAGSTGTYPNTVWNNHKSVLVSNTGVVGSDTTISTDSYRGEAQGFSYGGDKGIVIGGEGQDFANSASKTSSANRKNLISNTGIVASETACSGSKRYSGAGGEYGGDKGIQAYGVGNASSVGITSSNKVSNIGVVSSDITGVGTGRIYTSYVRYGGDKGLISGGIVVSSWSELQAHNLVSNTGVVATDVSHTHDARFRSIGCGYGS